jgi:hypothetical protein
MKNKLSARILFSKLSIIKNIIPNRIYYKLINPNGEIIAG